VYGLAADNQNKGNCKEKPFFSINRRVNHPSIVFIQLGDFRIDQWILKAGRERLRGENKLEQLKKAS